MKKKLFGVAVLAMFLLGVCGSALAADIYIPDDKPTIQEGIDAAVTGGKVIVRDGTYLLTAALDFKGKAITVKSEKGLGNCILDGQQKTRVVHFHSGETSKSVLSGFVIRNGQADKGGGILCDSSSPTISNCNIMANKAYYYYGNGAAAYGGGIYCVASSAIILNCTITGNSAVGSADGYHHGYSYGGGIFCDGGSPRIENCIISGNQATPSGGGTYASGGGIFLQGSSPYLLNPTISNNKVLASNRSVGGGLYSSASFPSIVNGVINSNSSQLGAAIYFESSSGSLTNCTVARNAATAAGGAGLYCANSSPTIVNSILWEDTAPEIFEDATSNPNVTYSDVFGGYDGTGNIDANPLFKNIGAGDFHLTAGSPCIDAGTNDAPELPLKDKDGKPRIVNGIVDMGPYEFQNQCPVITSFTANPTVGPPPLAVTFTCKATDADGTIKKYLWDFGDGKTGQTTTGTVKHTYNQDDNCTFMATVKVLDNAGCSSVESEPIIISACPGPDLVGKAEEYAFSDATKTISLKLRVTNKGNPDAGPFKATFHLSKNGSTPFAPFKEIPVNGLAAGQDVLLEVDNTFKSSIYGKYVLIYIDPDKAIQESDETNNGTRIVIQPMKTK